MQTTADKLNIEKLFAEAAKYRASDIHFSVTNPLYFRIDGELVPFGELKTLSAGFINNLVDYLLSKEQKEALSKDREIIFGYAAGDGTRFKVHVFYQSGQLSVSMKMIPNQVKTLAELGLPEQALEMAKQTKGILIIAGPSDSGKSTTMAAFLEHINQTRPEHIVTIEDPIEHVFIDNKSIIEQRELGKDVLSHSQALDLVLKEDVNVVMVPDLEEAGIISRVLDVAESNRLVLTSVNSESATKAIGKIISSFPENVRDQIRRQLGDTLVGVVVQLLVPQIGGGRILAFEVLAPTPSVRSVIKEGSISQLDTIIQTSRQEGMISLDQSLAQLVREGKVEAGVAVKFAREPENFKTQIKA